MIEPDIDLTADEHELSERRDNCRKFRVCELSARCALNGRSSDC